MLLLYQKLNKAPTEIAGLKSLRKKTLILTDRGSPYSPKHGSIISVVGKILLRSYGAFEYTKSPI